MKKLIKLFLALPSLNIRELYKFIVLSAAKEMPTIKIHKTDYGIFSGLENDYLFQQALSNGTNEKHFVSLINLILNTDSVALDLGGNIGTHSIAMAKLAREGRVITFEPQSLTFSILQNNLLLNNCNNVSAFRFACSDENYRTVSMQPFDFTGERINNGNLGVDPHSFTGDLVMSRTIDSLSLERLDFIKLDIQGSEVRALRGARDTISRFRPFMFVEIEQQHLKAMGGSSKELIELILSFNYALYRVENEYPCDHICVPLEKVEHFEKNLASRFDFNLSPIIAGREVELAFSDVNAQNYVSIKTYSS